MNKFSLILLIVLSIVSISSCNDKYRKEGDWDDNIKLSAKSVEFSASADSVTITTEGTGWWIIGVSVDGVEYATPDNLNIESESYSISNDCYVVERRNKNALFIKVDANPLGSPRTVLVHLEDGDYFDNVTITQKSK